MPKGRIEFNYERCKGCGLCVAFCPTKILELDKQNMNEKGYHLIRVIDMNKCIACTFCATMCPDSVITVYKVEEEKNG